MNTIPNTIGIDLAKSSFSYCIQNDRGRVVEQGDLRRLAFMEWLPQLPAGTVLAASVLNSGEKCLLVFM